MTTVEGIPTKNDAFSFDGWLASSGLSPLKDILIKHNMTTLDSLSTESSEFAAFISDPLLLPRAMLIPQTIQSMQQLQQNAYKYKKNNNTKNKPQIQSQQQQQQQQNIEGKSDGNKFDHENNNNNNNNNNINSIDSDNNSDTDPNSLFNRYKQYKKDKAEHRQRSQTSIASVSQLMDLSKPPIIKENTINNNIIKKKRKMVKLKKGDHVRFINSKKRQGIVRFIGETEFDDGIFYGIQLTAGESGDCDGSIDGVEYFTCNYAMGIFVKRKILRRIKPPGSPSKKQKDSPKRLPKTKSKTHKKMTDRDKWKHKLQKKKKKRTNNKRPATLGACDFSTMFNKRTTNKKKNDEYYKKMRQELKKAGPRDIGKIKYKPPAIKSKRKREKKKKLSMNDIDRAELPIIQPKLGPRDIGKIKYDGLKLSKKQKEDLGLISKKNSKFLEDNLSHSTRKLKKFGSKEDLFGVKLGPQEIGKIKYKGTKLTRKQKEELKSGTVFEERVAHSVKKKKKLHRRSKSLVGSKLGPIEMGKNSDYRGTKMVDMDDGKDILCEKTHVVIKKKWHIKKDDDMDYSSDDSDGISDLDIDTDDDMDNRKEFNSGGSRSDDEDSDDLENALSLKPKKKRPLTAKQYGKDGDKFGTKRVKTPRKRNKKGLKIKKDAALMARSAPTLQRMKSSPTSPPHISTPKGKSKNGFKQKRKKKNKKMGKKDKKKGKKKRKKKEKIGALGLAEFEKYKQKLNVIDLNKSETSPAPKHYASESDQEYIENMKNNAYYKEESISDKQIDNNNNNITSPITPVTPITPLIDKDDTSDKPVTPISFKHEEIAHYVHVDPTESDTDNESLAGSLNALSSDEDLNILESNYNIYNAQETKWI